LTYGDFEYEWFGRELRGYTDTYSGVSAEFVYGYDGLRTKKLVNDGTYVNEYDYLWSPYDGKLVAYVIHLGETNESVSVMILRDENDEPFGITLNEQAFYYVKNLQGDVVRIVDGDGVTVLDYFYDAWGNITFDFGVDLPLAVMVWMYNPITYRGYYFDAESGLYYLQSRYYNPEWGRVINGDVEEYISKQSLTRFNPEPSYLEPEIIATEIIILENISANSFLYGGNNPVLYVAAATSSYSVQKALDYAAKWWRKYNPKFPVRGNDCTSFVSQCLNAGGWLMTPKWFYLSIGTIKIKITKSWGRVDGLYNYLKSNRKITPSEYKDKSTFEKAVKDGKVKNGAVVTQVRKSDGYFEHSAIIGRIDKTKGKAYYYGHDVPRDAMDDDSNVDHMIDDIYKIYVFNIS